MPKCAEIEGLVMDRLDGTLADARRADLEAHLAECPACRDREARLLKSLALARAAVNASEADGGPTPEPLLRSIIDKRLKGE